MIKLMQILILVPMLVSCSGPRGAYESIQTAQRSECLYMAGDEYNKCIEKYSKPYDEYKRERDEILKKN